jgi:hypothetical protein
VVIADMQQKLGRDASMASSLESFVQQVYKRQDLMRGGDDLANRIYRMYATSDATGADRVTDGKEFYRAIKKAVPQWLSCGQLQNHRPRVTFADLIRLCGQPAPLPEDYLSDFLYFSPNTGDADWRLYLNVGLDNIPEVLSMIWSYTKLHTTNHGVVELKSCGPAVAGQRTDAIVVYCRDKHAAEALGAALLDSRYASLFNPGVPRMTTQLSRGIGIAIGAEPKQQQTGMGTGAPGRPNAQSFGTIRSQLIAMAIVNFNENKGLYGSGLDAFKKFVCAAFTGYGLDPMNPGN